MRELTKKEIIKRGCTYCADKKKVYDAKIHFNMSHCPYNKCPYHQLDNVETYGEYIQKTNTSGLARALADLTKE